MNRGNKRTLKSLADLPSWQWEEEDSDRILEALKNTGEDASERFLAADLAGECAVFRHEMADTLLEIVGRQDEVTALREAAALSLGPFLEQADLLDFDEMDSLSADRIHRIQNRLRQLFFDAAVPAALRRRILETSVRAFQKWHANAVRAAYKSHDDDWQLTALFSMSFVRGFEREILDGLSRKDPDILCHAVRAAGNWGLDEAWSRIAPLVTGRHVDKALRIAAIEAVAGIRPGEAMDLLRGLAFSDDDIDDAVTEALAMAEGLADAGDLDDDPFH